MATSSRPKLAVFKSSGVIKPYSFVKFGVDKETVVQAGHNERSIGISQNVLDTIDGDPVEIGLPGGGAKLKLVSAVGLGKMVTPSATTGYGEIADANGEWVGALAYEDGIANDIVGVEVVGFQAVASDA